MRIGKTGLVLVLFLLSPITAGDLYAGEPPANVDLPWKKMTPVARRITTRLIKHEDIKVTFPEENVQSSVKGYDFLLDRLPLTAELVRKMDLGEYNVIPRKNESVLVKDNKGIHLKMVPLYKKSGLRVFYTRGYWKNSLFPTLYGRGIIVLKYKARKGGGIQTRARLFFKVDSDFYKSLSGFLKGMTRNTIRKKVSKFIQAAQKIAKAVKDDPKIVRKKLNNAKYATPGTCKLFETMFFKKKQKKNASAKPEDSDANDSN